MQVNLYTISLSFYVKSIYMIEIDKVGSDTNKLHVAIKF
jgi:hypothetical protein